MRRHVLSVSLFVVVLSGGAASVAWAQAQELALRGPRFVAVWKPSAEALDASNAVVLRRRVSLDLTNATADEALKEITRQADLEISYSKAMLPNRKSVSLHVREITVAAALTEVLLDAGVDVAVARGGSLALVKRVLEAPSAPADTGTVTGRVVDKQTGTPLSGATVALEGTQHNATTSPDGRYRLAGVSLGAYTITARYIGYEPGSTLVTISSNQPAVSNFALERSIEQLDQIVVTGTVVPTERKALPTPITVISGDEIQQQNLRRVDQIFRGQVPGSLAWDQPTRDHFSVTNIRGTSSFDISTVKTFIDGVEVADPTYLAMIDANSVDRVEVIRGPQASTIYGSGAINGVIQVFTKKGARGAPRPRAEAKMAVGNIPGAGGSGSALRQDYSIGMSGGAEKLSYALGGSYLSTGEWVPQYYSRNYNFNGGAHAVQGPVRVEVTGRYAGKDYGPPWPTALRDSGFTPYVTPPREKDQITQQTYGVRLSFTASPHWEHSLTLGYDRLSNEFFNTQPRFTVPSDSLLQVYSGQTAKASLAYNTTVRFALANTVTSVATIGVDYYHYTNGFYYTSDADRNVGAIDGTFFVVRTPFNNAGLFAQQQLGISNALFLTAGIRVEKNDNFGTEFGTAVSPRVGASYVRSLGDLTVKTRLSYGEAIRPPTPDQKQAGRTPFSIQLAATNLGPERQRGVDGGIELYFAKQLSAAVTYYNQTAIDLIDNVLLDPGTAGGFPTYQNQNVGQIKNKGWEFEARLDVTPVQLSGTYSFTTSTVQELSATYGGDLKVGDRLLGVPRSSGGVTLTAMPLRGTAVSAGLTHVASWIGTDDIALAGFYYGGRPYRGSGRDYWLVYPAFTKLNLAISQVVNNYVSAFVRAENVANSDALERDNLNVPIGRVVIVGGRLQY